MRHGLHVSCYVTVRPSTEAQSGPERQRADTRPVACLARRSVPAELDTQKVANDPPREACLVIGCLLGDGGAGGVGVDAF